MNEPKDLKKYAEFFKSVGERGATREDLMRFLRISDIESRIVMKHLVARGVVRAIGRKSAGGKVTISLYQFMEFNFVPVRKPIVTVRDAIDVLGHDEDFDTYREPEPTGFKAWSLEKIEVLRRRVDRGEKLFSKLDCDEVELR